MKTDHELRFAYALYLLFGIILHTYDYWYFKALFIGWVAYELVFAVLNRVTTESLVVTNLIGLATFYCVWKGYDVLYILPLYIAWGLYLNYLGLKR